MTGEVLEEEENQPGKGSQLGKGPVGKGSQLGVNLTGKGSQSGESPAGVRKQLGDAGSSGRSAAKANPFSKVGIHTNVGGRSRDTIRKGDKRPGSRKSVPQCSRLRSEYEKLPDLSPSQRESVVSETSRGKL